jgi:hypothetical protein
MAVFANLHYGYKLPSSLSTVFHGIFFSIHGIFFSSRDIIPEPGNGFHASIYKYYSSTFALDFSKTSATKVRKSVDNLHLHNLRQSFVMYIRHEVILLSRSVDNYMLSTRLYFFSSWHRLAQYIQAWIFVFIATNRKCGFCYIWVILRRNVLLGVELVVWSRADSVNRDLITSLINVNIQNDISKLN